MWLSQIHNFKSTWISLLALIIDSNFIEPPVWDTIVILTNEPMIYSFICYLPSYSRISRSLGDVTIKGEGQSSAPVTFELGGVFIVPQLL